MPVRFDAFNHAFAHAFAHASADAKAEVRMPVPDHGTGVVQNLQVMIPSGREESPTDGGPERPVLPGSAGPSYQSSAHPSPALMHFIESGNKSTQKNGTDGQNRQMWQTVAAFLQVIREGAEGPQKPIAVERATWPIPEGFLLLPKPPPPHEGA